MAAGECRGVDFPGRSSAIASCVLLPKCDSARKDRPVPKGSFFFGIGGPALFSILLHDRFLIGAQLVIVSRATRNESPISIKMWSV